MSRRSDKILFYFCNTIFISIFISIFIYGSMYREGFKKRALITTGYISGMGSSGNYKTGGYYYSFVYEVKGKRYSNSENVNSLLMIKKIMERQSRFHVLYDSLDPSDSRLLTDEVTYGIYKPTMLDSIKKK